METHVTKPQVQINLEKLLDEEHLKKLGLEERIAYLDRLTELAGEEPNIIEQIVFGKRKEAKAIQELKITAINAKSKVLSVLGNSLTILVKQEEGLLGTRYSAAVVGTSEMFIRQLNQVNEKCITNLVDDYLDTIREIESKSGLGINLKETLLKEAEERLGQRQHDTFNNYREVLGEFRRLVKDIVTAIKGS